MSSKDDLSRDEIDVLRQIADGEALIRLSVYFSRPYVDFLQKLVAQRRVSPEEMVKVTREVGLRFDELATEMPELRDQKSVLVKEDGPN